MAFSKLRREVPRRRVRGNKFWYRAAAASFFIKLGLLVGIFLVVHAAF